MLIVKMKGNLIKKTGCTLAMLLVFGIPVFFIGELYYYVFQKRTYVEIDRDKTITIWKNCIILDWYWYPIYPKDNYILINSTSDYYDVEFTITQDSVLGIWSNESVSVYGMENFKTIEMFAGSKRDYWANKYSFANVTNARRDSIFFEFSYQFWFPCSVQKCVYIYNMGTGVIKRNFE